MTSEEKYKADAVSYRKDAIFWREECEKEGMARQTFENELDYLRAALEERGENVDELIELGKALYRNRVNLDELRASNEFVGALVPDTSFMGV